jgi:cobalamin transport system substrate-binding protein
LIRSKEDLVRKSVLIVVLLTLIIASSGLVACGSTSSTEALTDDQGREVLVPGNPQRIVCLGAPITEILFRLGLGDRVVGIDDYSDYPDEAKSITKVGSPWPGFSTEIILNQEPDLILSSAGTVVQQLEGHGVPVFVIQPRDIAGIYEDIKLIGQMTGKKKQANDLIENLTARARAVSDKTSGLTDDQRPTVFYEVDASDPTSPYTVGSGTFQDELIAMAGGKNIADSQSGWYPMSMEKILDADPDMIVLEDSQYGVSLENIRSRSSAWAGLSAVKSGNVYPVEDPDLTSRYGPRIVDGLEALARIIHPEIFSNGG